MFNTTLRKIRKYLWVVVLWSAFTVGCFCAPVFAIVYLVVRHNSYMTNFIKAADRMMAAMLGFSGRFMLSTECAHSPYFKWMRNILNNIEADHCESSIFQEGAYCRISDHKPGHN